MKKQEKEKFNLEEAFVLWKQTSKKGSSYLTGHDLHKNRLVGYFETNFTKKSESQPDIRVYDLDENGKNKNEVCVLWLSTSKSGKIYYSGITSDEEKVIAFQTDDEEDLVKPFLKAYFKEEN